jgi:ABC-type transporter Mla MlaB component
VAELCERVRAFVESRATMPVVCDVSAITAPDAVSLDALARVQLVARRAGIPVGMHNAPAVLLDLLALVGLDEATSSEP